MAVLLVDAIDAIDAIDAFAVAASGDGQQLTSSSSWTSAGDTAEPDGRSHSLHEDQQFACWGG